MEIKRIKEKFAQKAILRLLRYKPEWMILHKQKWGKVRKQMNELLGVNAEVRREAKNALSLLELVKQENFRLTLENQALRENAGAFADKELVAENERLKAEAENAKAAYDALLEEMEGQL